MDPIWKLRTNDESPSLASETEPRAVDDSLFGSFPAPLKSLLERRGLEDPALIQNLLYPKLSQLKEASVLKDLNLAVDRLERAYLAQETVCIYADFDLDGTSGLALLWSGLTQLGFKNVLRYQPKRLSEGYGFHPAAVEDLHRQGVGLIVTVDVGITAHTACAKARELGVDVIITDHHLPAESLPEALAVVNPNQKQDVSGLGYLCGAGVAFSLLRGLKKRFYDKGFPTDHLDLKSLLDFFTIATLTDMVPLIEDNRVLVKHGLTVLAETTRPGLRALLEALELSGRPLTSQDVAIRFAPKLNALSRMENGVLPIDILLCEDRAKARELMTVVLENNTTRVQLQADAEQEAMALLSGWTEPDFVFVASENFHRGVVGLIATRLAQNFNRPAFVGALDPEEGVIVGSARRPPGSEVCLVGALGSASEELTRFGGHSAAAGFELHSRQGEAFQSSLKNHFESLRQAPRPLEYNYDVDVSLSDLDSRFMTWHDFMGPYGVGFETPLFRIKDLQLRGVRNLKGGHLKLQVSDRARAHTMDALLFSPSPRQTELIGGASAGSFEILGELQWNYYNGSKTLQILVKDLKVQSWQ